MILYHGTSITAVNSILSGVCADINEFTELDFGKGFYCSPEKDKKYARKHAIKVVKSNIGKKKVLTNAVIVKCKLSDELISNPLVFTKKSREFIDFVFHTRLNYMKEDISYDFIRGPMADGTVDTLMSFYIKHKNSAAMKLVKWCYKLPFNSYEQVVLKTQKLCDHVEILEIKNLKGEVLYEQK